MLKQSHPMHAPDTTPPRPVRDKLSLKAARRIALAAQGFGGERVAEHSGFAQMRRMVERLGLLQIDSVNVLVRSHYLPLFSRLGPYPTARLDAAALGRKRALFEYWGHEASLLPVARLSAAALAHGAGQGRASASMAGWRASPASKRPFLDAVLAEIRDARPAQRRRAHRTAGAAKAAGGAGATASSAVEYLFWAGELTTAERRGFERVYDLPERVLPHDVLAAPVPTEEEAQRQLLLISARALGVGTEFDLRDYFRLEVADTKARLAELVEAGALIPVTVEGWRNPAYLDPNARIPAASRRMRCCRRSTR